MEDDTLRTLQNDSLGIVTTVENFALTIEGEIKVVIIYGHLKYEK